MAEQRIAGCTIARESNGLIRISRLHSTTDIENIRINNDKRDAVVQHLDTLTTFPRTVHIHEPRGERTIANTEGPSHEQLLSERSIPVTFANAEELALFKELLQSV